MLASVTLNIIWKSYLLGKMNMTGWNGKSLKIVGLTVNDVKDIVKVAVSVMLANGLQLYLVAILKENVLINKKSRYEKQSYK